MQCAILSAPAPPYSSGTWIASRSAAFERLVDVPRVLGRLVDLGRPRRDHVLGEVPDRLPEQLVLFGELVDGKLMSTRPSYGPPCFMVAEGPADAADDLTPCRISMSDRASHRITVLGTGYLGATHAACMAELGFEVLGLDVDKAKIDKLAPR